MGRLIRWIARLQLPRRRWRVIATVEAADEVQDRLPTRGAVLVMAGREPSWLAFDCPCGTGHRLLINLHFSRRPKWTVMNEQPLTVWPSIDSRRIERRCHFSFRDGKVRWANDYERMAAA